MASRQQTRQLALESLAARQLFCVDAVCVCDFAAAERIDVEQEIREIRQDLKQIGEQLRADTPTVEVLDPPPMPQLTDLDAYFDDLGRDAFPVEEPEDIELPPPVDLRPSRILLPEESEDPPISLLCPWGLIDMVGFHANFSQQLPAAGVQVNETLFLNRVTVESESLVPATYHGWDPGCLPLLRTMLKTQLVK